MERGDGRVICETARLRLRNWHKRDFAPFVARTNTPAVMRWLGGVADPQALHQRLSTRLTRWQEERGYTFWAVETRAQGDVIGFCGIKIADDPGSPVEGEYEIGWRLAEEAWGQGYAKEAAIAALDHAFGTLGAEQVVALTVDGNAPSWGLMERLGMRRRGDLDYEGPEWAGAPVIVYLIRREQWKARKS